MRHRLPGVASVLFAILLSVVAGRAGSEDPAGIKTFGTWTATCNNLAECTAVGAEDGELVSLRVMRGARADDEPSMTFALMRIDSDKTPVTRASLTAVDGGNKTALTVPAPRVSADDDRLVIIELPSGAAGRGFVEATRNAATLAFEIGTAKGSLPLKGMSAALRWIDDRQGRAGSVGALVAKGDAPDTQVPPRPPVPEVAAAPVGSVAELNEPTITVALRKAMPKGDDCDEDIVSAPEPSQNVSVWKLAPDRLLVFVPCTRGAYNFGSALFFTDAKGNSPRPVRLLYPGGLRANAASSIVVNAELDPDKMELTEFDKGRGLGDCGTQVKWVWTGRGFALLEASASTTCTGLPAENWPNLYRAVKK